MPTLCTFDTRTVHSAANPVRDTQVIVNFPRTFVAPPRAPHGIRLLDVGTSAHIRVSSTIQHLTETWADCHFTTWAGSILHCGVSDVLVLAPGDLEFLTGEYNLDDPASVRVNFERPFVTPPKVVVFFNHIDLDKKHNWRVNTTATGIDRNGFMLNITTWSDTILHAAQVCWIAYPEDREHIFSTSVNTTDVRPWNQPQLQQSEAITFDTVEFFKDPAVFIALNSFDIGCEANLRINAYVDTVSRTGLVWHIDSWADTVLYSASASIIAFN